MRTDAWFTNFESATEASKKSRKPILLQFEMDGCGGCRKLYAETYTDPYVASELQDWFVLLKLDLIKDRDIRRKLSAYWTPSFYFLDHTGKSFYNFNGFIPANEFRIIMRLGYAETKIPRGRYADAVDVMGRDIAHFDNSPLLPTLLAQRAVAEYIRTKDKPLFMKTMAQIRASHQDSLEAKMYFWNDQGAAD